MYADRDRKGMASLMEIREAEEKALLEALKHHKEYCDTVCQLFDYREDFKEKSSILERMINQMESI